MSAVNVFMVELNRKPFLEFEYEGLDLSAYSAITLRMRRPDNTVVEIDGDIDDAENGKFHFEFGDSDVVAGVSTAEVDLTDADGLTETLFAEEPMRLVVRKKV